MAVNCLCASTPLPKAFRCSGKSAWNSTLESFVKKIILALGGGLGR